MTALQILKEKWGHDSFRFNQKEIIDCVLDGKDTIALLPTGGGKSVCYQIPGIIKPGLVLVISPLISLMHDQVRGLQNIGEKAIALTSGISKSDLEREVENCQNGHYNFLLVSPERLKSEWLRERLKHIKVNLITVDEAHCISQWGHDFRPPYLQIKEIKTYIPNVPILALTATANKHVLKDIQTYLDLENPTVFKNSFLRENIEINIRKTEDKLNPLSSTLSEKSGSSIVYLRSRKKTVEFAKLLNYKGLSADFFHAGLSIAERATKQKKWLVEKIKIIVATTAFGMGIDKPNVRTIVHPDLPEDLESYYQEIGRAGRDGKPSKAYLFYNDQDFSRLHYKWIEQFPSLEDIKFIYKKLCAHLQIAVGLGGFRGYPFSITEFCKKYNLEINKTLNGFNFLQKQGFLEYSQNHHKPAMVKFIKINEIDDNLNSDITTLTKTLVRSYGGITQVSTKVDLPLISKRINRPLESVKKNLQLLANRNLIWYSPPKNGELIIFTKDRVADKYLNLDKHDYKQILKIRTNKLESLKRFVTETKICRNKILLQYFDETLEQDCGICDNCRKTKIVNIKAHLLSLLINPQDLKQLVQSFPFHLQDDVIKEIRILIDQNELKKTGTRISKTS